MPDERHAGLVSELTKLQCAINAETAKMSPKERAEAAKRDLEAMPGQRYLFEDDAA